MTVNFSVEIDYAELLETCKFLLPECSDEVAGKIIDDYFRTPKKIDFALITKNDIRRYHANGFMALMLNLQDCMTDAEQQQGKIITLDKQ